MVVVLGILCVWLVVEKVRAQRLCSPGLYLALALVTGAALVPLVGMFGIGL